MNTEINTFLLNSNIVLFDGRCKLCNAWCRFIIRYDKERLFRLASMQSEKGQEILEHLNQPLKNFESMLLIESGTIYDKSSAFIKIIKRFPIPINLLSILIIIPKPIRNVVYNLIAKYRYKLFGRYNQCILVQTDHKKRYL